MSGTIQLESESRGNPLYLVAISLGLVAVPLKLIYSFFPLFNLVDVGLFLGIGLIFGRWSGRNRWTLAVALALPTVLISGYFAVRVGASLLEGVGLGWALSVILVPSSAVGGLYAGVRSRQA